MKRCQSRRAVGSPCSRRRNQPRARSSRSLAARLPLLGDLAVDAHVEVDELVGGDALQELVGAVELPREEELPEAGAPVAEVVDADRAPAARSVDLDEAVPDHRRAEVVERERLRHVRARVVDDDGLALALGRVSELLPAACDGLERPPGHRLVLDEHVDVGTLRPGLGDAVARLEGAGDLGGDGGRGLAQLLRQGEAGKRELAALRLREREEAVDVGLLQPRGAGEESNGGDASLIHDAGYSRANPGS